MTEMITTHDLTKSYGGHPVVEGVNLSVPQGSVYGLLGPNGSGKSTTMKMVLALVRPTSGSITIADRPMLRSTRRELLADIGSLIESPPAYPHLTGAENMRLIARLLDLDDAQIDRAVDTVRLREHLDKRVRDYSLGMKQRLGIALALAREPRLLILDEPTNGLDPAGIEEIRELLRRLSDRGVTVLVSSHLLDEVERTATVLGILDRGRLVFQGTPADLVNRSSPDVLVDTSEPARAAAVTARRHRAQVDGHTVRISGLDRAATAEVVSRLVGDGIDVYGVRRDTMSLQDVFMNLTAGQSL
ncbi:ABC transporter ATP-binding protein [Williamsia phyllosphaerae]|uniref:Bacitracin ABC transporter ATP-binding protein n=1 Tax=Williamsia phyllosphaerae TaxID=885042 RepID=A0ABQ1U8W9_9NOCA|nr:ABC transporter ATP-binding protein [Williamsia phyllosphaerae]GGF13507.1 bacitracin ABC transporter ATP-binding protein [Williamsia phyllosphaerae]